MRLAVVGGGSTYTPELVDGFARLRDVLPVDELVLVDPAADRLELVGGIAPADARAARATPAASPPPTDLDAGVDGRGRGAAAAARRRPGRARPRRDVAAATAAASARRPPGAGGLAKALRTVPVVLDIAERVRERATPDAWIVDFTNPVGIVTRALLAGGPPRGRAVQRGHRLPAPVRRAARRRARRRRARPRRAQPPDLGAARCVGRTAVGPCCRELLARARRRARRGARAARRAARELGVRPVVLPALLLRARRGASREQRGRARRAPPRSAAIEDELLRAVRRPGARHQAGAARRSAAARSTPRPPSTWSPSLLGDRGDTAGRQRAQRRHAAVPARRRRDRGARDGRRRRARTPLPVAPLEPLLRRAGRARHRVRGPRPATPRVHGGRDRVVEALLAHPLVGQVDQADGAHRPAARATNARAPAVGDDVDPAARSLAVDGGNSKTDVVARRPRRHAARARPRGDDVHRTCSGAEAAFAVARRAGRRARRRGRRRSLRATPCVRRRRRLPRRTPTCPARSRRSARPSRRSGWAPDSRRRERHVRAAAGRAPTSATRWPSSAAPASTASASAPTGARCASRRSGRSPATGAAAGSSARRRCGPRPGTRTGGVRGRRSPPGSRRTSG